LQGAPWIGFLKAEFEAHHKIHPPVSVLADRGSDRIDLVFFQA
jgi:hypothetical protein